MINIKYPEPVSRWSYSSSDLEECREISTPSTPRSGRGDLQSRFSGSSMDSFPNRISCSDRSATDFKNRKIHRSFPYGGGKQERTLVSRFSDDSSKSFDPDAGKGIGHILSLYLEEGQSEPTDFLPKIRNSIDIDKYQSDIERSKSICENNYAIMLKVPQGSYGKPVSIENASGLKLKKLHVKTKKILSFFTICRKIKFKASRAKVNRE